MYVDNNSKLIACKPSKLKKNFKKSVIAEEKTPLYLLERTVVRKM